MMIRLLLNCAFTLLWLLLWQSSSFLNGVLGFVISALIITLASRVIGSVQTADASATAPPSRPSVPVVGYALRLVNVLRFGVYFLYILIKANLDVAWEIITPGFRMKPRMIRYPVAGLTRAQVTTLANAITLTPGTLSADIDESGQNLYIHAMYAERRGDAIAELDGLRRRLLWLVFGRRPDETPQEDPPTS
jgi:multicomponent Na+:H+ antiporter subunit E